MINPSDYGIRGANYNQEKGYWSVYCPDHNDNNHSAILNDKGFLYCFVCGTKRYLTNIQNYVNIYINTSDLLEEANSSHEERYELELEQIKGAKLALNNSYLHSRGLSEEEIIHYKILEDEEGVIFPLYSSNEIMCYQKRYYDKEPKYKFLAIKKRPLIFPIDLYLKEVKEDNFNPIFCEGIFGMLKGRREGFQAFTCFGVSNFSKVVYLIKNNGAIVVDDDKAGIKTGFDLLKKHPSLQVYSFEADTDNWGDYIMRG